MSVKKKPAWLGRLARDCMIWDIDYKEVAEKAGMLPQSLSRVVVKGSCSPSTQVRIVAALDRLIEERKGE